MFGLAAVHWCTAHYFPLNLIPPHLSFLSYIKEGTTGIKWSDLIKQTQVSVKD